jgi:hypothetical protein
MLSKAGGLTANSTLSSGGLEVNDINALSAYILHEANLASHRVSQK